MKILGVSSCLGLKQPKVPFEKGYLLILLLAVLILIWPVAQRVVAYGDPTIGFVDPNVWLLLLLSLISFLVFLGLCWWLLQVFWRMMDLPALQHLVSQFKTLESWQQLSFFWASFALLLLVALGMFTAVI